MPLRPFTVAALILSAPAALAAPTAEEIANAGFEGGTLPEGQSALAARLQIMLDRVDISPGVIDGYKGGMTTSALKAYETREGFKVDGVLDPEVWAALNSSVSDALTQSYTITEEDTSGLSADPLPTDYGEMAKLDQLGYTSVSEKLAERFHMDEDFLKAMNPDVSFTAGETITVVAPGERSDVDVARIEVRKSVGRLAAFDEAGKMVANYPVTVGSDQTPSPEGEVTVKVVAFDPTYSYNPDKNFQQGDNDEPLTLPPGPNGPVGSVWIDLSKPTYGIHGTSDPASLFQSASHGCVRMTNWDANELGQRVREGAVVEFVE